MTQRIQSLIETNCLSIAMIVLIKTEQRKISYLITGPCRQCIRAKSTKHDQQTSTTHGNYREKGIFGILLSHFLLHVFGN